MTRAFSVAVLTLVFLPLTAAPSFGDVGVPVTQEGWAWELQHELAPSAAAASGVGEDQLPISNGVGGAKVSYVRFEVSDLPTSSFEISALTLRMPLDPDAMQVNVDGAAIQGCLVLDQWLAGGSQPWGTRPRTDCDAAAAPGTYDADNDEFTFDLTAFLIEWQGPYNFGLALEADPAAAAPFQVLFKGSKAAGVIAQAALTPTPPPPIPPAGGDSASAGGAEEGPALPGGSLPGPTSAVSPPGLQPPLPAQRNEDQDAFQPQPAPIAVTGQPTFGWISTGLLTLLLLPAIARGSQATARRIASNEELVETYRALRGG